MDSSLVKHSKTEQAAASSAFLSQGGPGAPNISYYNDQFVWPWTGIILNVTKLVGQDDVTEFEKKIKEQLNRFNPVGVRLLWDPQKFSGHAVVIFTGDMAGFMKAMLFENAFSLLSSDKWKELKHNGLDIYGWIARVDDYNDDSVLGHYLRKNGVLRTISDINQEDAKRKSLLVALAKEVDVNNQRLVEMDRRYDRILLEKDELRQAYAEETKKNQCLIEEIEKLKLELESQTKEREQNENEKKKLIHDNREEKWKLQLIEGKLKVPKFAGDDNDVKEMDHLHKELEEKENQIKDLEDINQTLTVKEHMSNHELQEARKEFVSGLKDVNRRRGSIGVKRLGVIDEKPFKDACRQQFSPEEASVRAAEMCTSWQELVNNASWHPFKMTTSDGKLQEIIDENDENIKVLKEESSDGVYMAVTTALLELNEFNPSGRYAIQELWNFAEKRKASLKEVAQHMLKRLKSRKG